MTIKTKPIRFIHIEAGYDGYYITFTRRIPHMVRKNRVYEFPYTEENTTRVIELVKYCSFMGRPVHTESLGHICYSIKNRQATTRMHITMTTKTNLLRYLHIKIEYDGYYVSFVRYAFGEIRETREYHLPFTRPNCIRVANLILIASNNGSLITRLYDNLVSYSF